MVRIESKIDKALGNRQNLEDLLLLEKERRGIDHEKLLFIGIADTASYYWCAMKSLFENKSMELAFFTCYLQDRISYAFQLGFINKLPKNKEMLLEIGKEISFNHIETLLKKRAKRHQGTDMTSLAETVTDKDGNKFMVINPDLSSDEKAFFAERAKSEGIRIADAEEFPLIRGKLIETTRAERYPTMRWNFDWKNYVLVGVPDGITNNFVYEFKTTKDKFLMAYLRPVAFTQADLYGYFFKRETKRVQMFIKSEGAIETWNEAIDVNRVIETLSKFKKMDEGEKPLPPRQWKCGKCEFRESCKLQIK